MLILLLFAMIAGALTILAPCVWPLLPVLLSSESNLAGRKRPLGLVTGVVISFGALTLSASFLEKSLGIKEQYIRDFSVILLIAMGILLLIPPLTARFESRISYWVSAIAPKPKPNSSGFRGGFVVGLSLGILWTPCTGPIFAAITTQAAGSHLTIQIFLITAAYLLGIAVPLYFLVLGGKQVFERVRVINRHLGRVQIISGVVLIAFAIATATGYDKSAEVYLINNLPSYTNLLTSVEKTSTVQKELTKVTSGNSHTSQKLANLANPSSTNSHLFNIPSGVKAPEIVGDTSWINSQPITLASLRGKVTLVDFWTYTCINCIRSLHYVSRWYDTYHSKGLQVIGIHSPEFPFEQDRNNVIAAVHRLGVTYPVVQDNHLDTWNAFNNEYWPAEYLIDAQGYIRRADFGEGGYDTMEAAIQALLRDTGASISNPISDPLNVNFSHQTSLETYLGSNRADQIQNPYQSISNGSHNFTAPHDLSANTYSLNGRWSVSNQSITASNQSEISYHFTGHQVYIILRPSKPGAIDHVHLYLNGSLLTGSTAGSDVKSGVITVDSDRLYNIFDSHSIFSDGTLRLVFDQANTQAFTFTFG